MGWRLLILTGEVGIDLLNPRKLADCPLNLTVGKEGLQNLLRVHINSNHTWEEHGDQLATSF